MSLSACESSTLPPYGEKITYSESNPIEYPDFNFKYIGERQLNKKEEGFFSGSFLYYDFEVWDKNNTQTVSWSSGTGDIAPTAFKFNGKDYLLEKGMSDILGQLKENELVIWEKEDYEEQQFLRRGS